MMGVEWKESYKQSTQAEDSSV